MYSILVPESFFVSWIFFFRFIRWFVQSFANRLNVCLPRPLVGRRNSEFKIFTGAVSRILLSVVEVFYVFFQVWSMNCLPCSPRNSYCIRHLCIVRPPARIFLLTSLMNPLFWQLHLVGNKRIHHLLLKNFAKKNPDCNWYWCQSQ